MTLLSLFDYSKYKVDLFLHQRGGMFENMIPPQVTILDGMEYTRFTVLPLIPLLFESIRAHEFKKIIARITFSVQQRLSFKKVHGAQKFWEIMGGLIEKNPVQYDAAIAFSQGFPTYYVAEKIKSDKKFAVVNIDYSAAGYNRNHDFRYYIKFNKIVVDSEKVKEIMQSTYPEFRENIEIIHHILNPTFMEHQAENGESYEDSFDGIRLLTIGRLVTQKGYDIAMEACCRLKEKGLKCRWYVLGDGPLYSQMQDYLKKNTLQNDFILLGVKLNPYPYLKNCDIYVQTSRFEGYGIALAEARMFNKPIVTTDFDVVYEQIENGQNGLVVEMNADAVCNGILTLVEDEKLMKRMVECLKKEKKGNVEEVEKWYNFIDADV